MTVPSRSQPRRLRSWKVESTRILRAYSRILAHALPSGGLVGEDDPGFPLLRLPGGADLGRHGTLLPELYRAIPLASALGREASTRNPALRATPACGLAGVCSRQTEHVMPPTLRTQVDQRMSDEAAIGQQRARGGADVWNDAVEQHADHLPLPLFPFLVHGQRLPTDRHEARRDPPTQIQHGRAVAHRRRVEHEDQASIAPEAQELAQQVGPQRDDGDLLMGQKPRQAALAAGRLGRADADKRFRPPGQPRRARQHDAQDKKCQGLAAAPRRLRHEGPQLTRPLAPQTL